ncbi:MAG TPA: hypothetical protein VFO46_25295 [Candidatus Sulfotelmatobacter sp.]|nr:hypothetical protein [Candidatus Sulfotelmatobacter sp.]
MTYVQPQFNITVNIWRGGNAVTNPPDLSPLGNLSPGRIVGVNTELDQFSSNNTGGMWLRLPANTDIRDKKASTGEDTVEAPAGSGKWYKAAWVDDIGAGFTNEHRFAMLRAVGPWNTPYGSGGGGPGGGGGGQLAVVTWAIPPTGLATSTPLHFSFPLDSTVVVTYAAIDAGGRPKVDANIIQGQVPRAFTVGIHTLTLYHFVLYQPAGSTIGSVTDEFNTNCWRWVMGYTIPGIGWSNNTQSGNNGAGGPPMFNPPNNPFSKPLAFVDEAIAFDAGPNPPTLATPYVYSPITAPVTAFATNWTVLCVLTQNPQSPPPTPTLGPLMGWNKWAVVAGELA